MAAREGGSALEAYLVRFGQCRWWALQCLAFPLPLSIQTHFCLCTCPIQAPAVV